MIQLILLCCSISSLTIYSSVVYVLVVIVEKLMWEKGSSISN